MQQCRRGFKKEADEYALEFRSELGLAQTSPICPWKLAAHLRIPVLTLSDLEHLLPEEVGHLRDGGSKDFSAATVFDGPRRQILLNDGHSPVRQASDLAHELAHGILGHPATPPLSESGCRNFNRELEDEANWLGPALLVSKQAAFAIAFRGTTVEAAARSFRVSRPVFQMRLNVTGAAKAAQYRKKRRG